MRATRITYRHWNFRNNPISDHSTRGYQHQQLQRPPHSAQLLKHGGKTRYRVPKTWRKTFAVIGETWKNDPKARKKSLIYSGLITFGFFGTTLGFVKFLHFFGPGGGGSQWRQSIWNEVGNQDTDKSLEQMQQESNQGYIRNMFGIGTKAKMASLEQRAKNISEDRYRTWEDVMSKGFPRSAEEYKKVSKMRPETLDEYEIMDNLAREGKERKLSNAE